MSLKPGHEDCETCPQCGLTDCPDCDTDGRACPGIHTPSTGKSRERARRRKKR